MKILMVLTSHDQLGNTGEKTGFWLEEFAAPYYAFKDGGAKLTLASPKGGQPPLDPKSDSEDAQTEDTKRFKSDEDAQKALANTVKLSTVSADDFDAVFYPGGHGPLWDLTNDEHSVALIESFWKADKPIGAVCHAPTVLLNVKDEHGHALVKGRKVTLPAYRNGVGRAGFHDLCGQMLGPGDYLAVADAVKVLVLEDVPSLSRNNCFELWLSLECAPETPAA